MRIKIIYNCVCVCARACEYRCPWRAEAADSSGVGVPVLGAGAGFGS